MKFTKKGWIFAQTPIWTICDPNITDGALRLFAYLAWRQGNDNSCWPSVPTMAHDLNVSEQTIRRRLRELESENYLVTTHRIGRSSDYSLVADPDDASSKYTPTPHKSAGHEDKKEREEHDEERGDKVGSLWSDVKDSLRSIMTAATFEAHFITATPAALEGSNLVVALTNPRSLEAIQRLNGRIIDAIRAQHHVNLTFITAGEGDDDHSTES
jgi:DNA-binding transcriptional MocR family regulator